MYMPHPFKRCRAQKGSIEPQDGMSQIVFAACLRDSFLSARSELSVKPSVKGHSGSLFGTAQAAQLLAYSVTRPATDQTFDGAHARVAVTSPSLDRQRGHHCRLPAPLRLRSAVPARTWRRTAKRQGQRRIDREDFRPT